MAADKAQRNLKIVLGLFVYGATTFVVLAALGFWAAAHQFNVPGPLPESKTLIIERGQGLQGIAQNLSAAGIVDSPYIVIFGARIMNAQSDLKAGEYEFPAHVSAREAVQKIRDGDVVGRKVTVPEGRTSYEVVEMLKSIETLSGEVKEVPPEGALFPETYDFQKDATRSAMIERMALAMTEKLAGFCTLPELYPPYVTDWKAEKCAPQDTALPAPLETVGDVLTLASLIEKETGVPSERKRIAGVFINRLQKGMALQTDPTVIYALNKGRHENKGQGPLGRRLLSKDLQVDSPYNTYKYPGLPPGPIANPGLASIEAALAPEAHEFYYFVADGTGGHVFSKTLAEHNANVAKWRKIRRAQNQETP